MKKIGLVLSAVVLGVVVGLLATVLILKTAMESSTLKNGAWFHSPDVGSNTASGYTRMAISIIGFLGMTRDESIYFIAREDEQERLLSGECTYRIDGMFSEEDARWWSITVYNSITSKLIANDL